MSSPAAIAEDADLIARAKAVAAESGDPRTHVGCVIQHPLTGLVAEAANDLPARVAATPERLVAPEKYRWIEHAERRAIFKAAKAGVPTGGASLYVHGGFPCADCARAIIEAGIERVVYRLGAAMSPHWEDSFVVSRQLLAEAGVPFDEAPETHDPSS